MNNEEAYAIGARALAAGFEWRPGCLAVNRCENYGAAIYVCRDYDGRPMFCWLSPETEPATYDGMAPDVRDAGVVANMLAQVLAQVGDAFCLSRDKAGWVFKSGNVTSQLVPGIVGTVGPTPGEAMMVAMELIRRGDSKGYPP